MRPLLNKTDRRGEELCAYGQSDMVTQATLVADTNNTITVPDGAAWVVIQKLGTTEPLYARLDNGTSNAFTAVPGAGVNQEFMVEPYKRDLTLSDALRDDDPKATHIHFICAAGATVVANFYGY